MAIQLNPQLSTPCVELSRMEFAVNPDSVMLRGDMLFSLEERELKSLTPVGAEFF